LSYTPHGSFLSFFYRLGCGFVFFLVKNVSRGWDL